MKNIVVYAVENGVPRPLVSCSPSDDNKHFVVMAAGSDCVRVASLRGVPAPQLRVVLEERETGPDNLTLAKQSFTLLDPATLAAVGKPSGDLARLLKKE